ncbi:hypothetical protein [Aestuariivirga sp.]|jgi:hypothetical protein|uniref:hypothetical protein n=1 Tax=Aestuariivirga sp. TaxID=2650926 RepID=UPI0037837063
MGRCFGWVIGAVSGVMVWAGPLAAGEEAAFSNASLAGSYVYSNTNDGVASFGVIAFDGQGRVDLDIRINAPQADGQRTTIAAQGSGRFSVDAKGIGSADISMTKGPMGRLDYDFIIVEADDGLARKVFAVLRTGGVNNQLVHPTWTRRDDARPD